MEECLTLLHGCFLRFLNCTNDTRSHNAPHILAKGQQLIRKEFIHGYFLNILLNL